MSYSSAAHVPAKLRDRKDQNSSGCDGNYEGTTNTSEFPVSHPVKKMTSGTAIKGLTDDVCDSDDDCAVGTNNKNKEDTHETAAILPMNDENGPYFIDEELVIMYQDGLMFKRWNPTQVVYELCSQMQWVLPVYVQQPYSLAEGFLFSVTVNDREFFGCRGRSKKISQHSASTKFLHFLGFNFEFGENKLMPLNIFEQNHDKRINSNGTSFKFCGPREKMKESHGILRDSEKNEHLDRLLNKPYASNSNNNWKWKMRQESISSKVDLHRISSCVHRENKIKKY